MQLVSKRIYHKVIPISLAFRIHSGSETPFGQALRAFLVCQEKFYQLISKIDDVTKYLKNKNKTRAIVSNKLFQHLL